MKLKQNKKSGERKQEIKLPIKLEVPKPANLIFEKLFKPFFYGGINGK